MSKEIEIYYRYCDLDKVHEYSVVCAERDKIGYANNYWIYWIWYKMGVAFGERKQGKNKFQLLPFANTWDDGCRLIKSYKTINNGTDRVVPAILNHFKKIKPIKKNK